jgi:hypothetical protein
MTKLVLMIAMMAAIAMASSVGARAQTAAKATAATTGTVKQAPAIGPVSRPGGKPGAQIGQTGHPGFAALTKDECRKLGGSLQDDTKCKNAKRCVITLANGDVNSICIDEFR